MEINYDLSKRFKTLCYLSVIKAFEQEDGLCYFSREEFSDFININQIDKIGFIIKDLKDNMLIENLTINGYSFKIKVLDDKITCPEFMVDKRIPSHLRGFLYSIKDFEMPEKKVHRIKLLSEYLDIDKKKLERYLYKVDKLFNLEDLFNNSKNINLSILDFHPEFIKNSNGYRGGPEERSCIYCGKINHNDEYIKRYGCCRKCLNTIYIKDFEKISNNLLKRSRANSRNRNHDYKHTITKDYIKDIYISQECKCAYSGLEFDYSNKDGIPTIDRIDSNKGYEIGNIAIVRCDVNLMKSNMTLDQFNFLIDSICEHRKCGCNK